MKKNFYNKRKKKYFFFDIKKILIFLISIFLLIFLYLNYDNFSKIHLLLIEKFSNKFEYNLDIIEISNLKYLDKKEILSKVEKFKGNSIFLVPLKKISKDMLLLKWVKNISITSNYRNTLRINIEEEKPMGIYDNYNQKIIFSTNLVILDFIYNIDNLPKLIIFYGQNSINNSIKLISNFNIDFKNIISSAFYVNNRRWNIELDNSILLKLPENNIKEAINNYLKIYETISNKELQEIQSIDLRIKNKAIIKYKEK